jgi:hypothetical protein
LKVEKSQKEKSFKIKRPIKKVVKLVARATSRKQFTDENWRLRIENKYCLGTVNVCKYVFKNIGEKIIEAQLISS